MPLRSCRRAPLPSPRRAVALAAALCPLLTLAPLALPSAARAEKPRTDERLESLDSATRESIVEAAYANLEEYTLFASPDFTLEVDDFRHLELGDLDSVFWTDLVSPPQGLLVDMNREVQENGNLRASRSTYEPSFRYVDQPTSADLQRLEHMLASDVVAEITATDEDHGLHHLRALSSFRVRVTLGQDQRTYRAAFAWVPALAETGEDTAFLVVDHVTQGVEEAARDPHPPRRSRGFLKQTSRTHRAEKNGPGFAGGCAPFQDSKSVSYFDHDAADHFFGQHSASATFSIACSCDAGCNSSCIPSVTGKTCTDEGMPVTYCHKMQGVGRVKADTKYQTGASCGGGYLCAQKACLFCSCGLSVSVKVETGLGEAAVTFKADGASWAPPMEYTRTCPPCVPSDGDDGSGSGAGTGGGSGGGGAGDDGFGGGIGGGGGDGGGDGGSSSGPGSSGPGPGSGGGGGGISVYCDGQYKGQAASIADAMAMCEPEPDPAPGPSNPCESNPDACIT